MEARQSATAKKLRQQNIERVELNKYQHALSRVGYKGLLLKIMAERLPELRAQAQAQAQGLDPSSITDNQVPIPSRLELWVWAKKQKLTGKFFTEESASVGKKVEELGQQFKEGKFIKEGRKDILAVALGKEEHPRNVRGLRKGMDIKDLFESSSRGRSSGYMSMF